MKIHLDDNVLVTVGKDRGKTGKVIRVFKKNDKVVVEKINLRTKHIKKTAQQAGQRIRYEAPVYASNVKVVCPQCTKATRVGYTHIEGQKTRKQRVCKKCNETLDKEVKRNVTKKR